MLILHILYAELAGLEKSFLERHKEHGFLQGFTFSATTPVSISVDLSTVSTSTSTKRLVLLLDVDKCLSTSTSRRQVPGDAKVGELGLMCCILAQICRCIEIEQQCARKVENESCQKWSGEGQDKSATSLQTSFEASVPKSFDMWRASAMPKLTKLANVHSGSSLWIHLD